MNRAFSLLALCALAACVPAAVRPPASAAPADTAAPALHDRQVAVTIDDLPGVPPGDLPRLQKTTTDLLASLRREGIPAIGFVNEGKLYMGGEEQVAERMALLRQWLDAGFELGNHGYSHWDFQRTPLADFQADVERGELVTREMLAERGRRLRYFRHPFLHTGPDPETRAAFERFLEDRGYTVAPVTVDNDEWIYAAAYAKAAAAGDAASLQRIGEAYVRYMEEAFAFTERISRELLGREMRQTLLIHSNALNADWLDELAAMIRARGYRFISLDEALADEAYRLADTYTGPQGTSWILRWMYSRGQEPPHIPEASEEIRALAGVS